MTRQTPPERPPTDGGAPPMEIYVGGIDSKELLQQVLATLPAGLFTVDVEGTISCWNRAMEELTGLKAEEMVGQNCSAMQGDTCFGGPIGPPGKRCVLFEEKQGFDRKRCTLRRKDGSRVAVHKNARLMRNARGEIIGAIESVADLSEIEALQNEVSALRDRAKVRTEIIGRHPSMMALFDRIDLAAPSRASILITGETGTGKELVASAIHHSSPRRSRPFIRVSCPALSPSLVESELFGHVKGAFTGAATDRIGRFEAANGGTIFLDEISDLSIEVQTKLLRVLQEQQFERVGDSTTRTVNIRVLAATNVDLLQRCQEGRFRTDIYYRLATIPLTVPSLRERREDIPVLVEHFLERHAREQEGARPSIGPEVMDRLLEHTWPGNVRELEHAIEFALTVSRDGQIRPEDLPPLLRDPRSANGHHGGRRRHRRGDPRPAPETLQRALDAAGGIRAQAAAALGVSRVTLWKWLKEAGLGENGEGE
ncbi:MAG: sigma 54-interacting transcriptional regulator [Deltaproteobacteria bacterium]|nr:sigma 54-interacting transcriptional regulator [Deltaproteobacteria bacterium]